MLCGRTAGEVLATFAGRHPRTSGSFDVFSGSLDAPKKSARSTKRIAVGPFLPNSIRTASRTVNERIPSAAGFVLVGGRSSRLGFDKAAHPLDGTPAADRIARRLEAICEREVLLVGRDQAPWSAYPSIPDKSLSSSTTSSDMGPIIGVVTALEASSADVALVVATDLWNVSTSSMRELLREVVDQSGETRPDVAYAATGSGRGQPLCAAWRVDTCLRVAHRRLESGRYAMFGLLDELHSLAVPFDDDELININDSNDLGSFLRMQSHER